MYDMSGQRIEINEVSAQELAEPQLSVNLPAEVSMDTSHPGLAHAHVPPYPKSNEVHS